MSEAREPRVEKDPGVLMRRGLVGLRRASLDFLKPGSCCDRVKFGACSFAGFKDSRSVSASGADRVVAAGDAGTEVRHDGINQSGRTTLGHGRFAGAFPSGFGRTTPTAPDGPRARTGVGGQGLRSPPAPINPPQAAQFEAVREW